MFVQDVGELLLITGPAAQLMKPDATNVVREVILKEYVNLLEQWKPIKRKKCSKDVSKELTINHGQQP